MVRIIPGLFVHLAGYPRLAATFAYNLTRGQGFVTVGDVLNFFLASYFTVVGALMLYGQLKRLGGLITKTRKISLPVREPA